MAKIKLGGDIVGFWRPEMKGDKIIGVLDGFADADKPFFIIRLLKSTVVSVNTGQEGIYEAAKAQIGERVGLTAYTQLLNLKLNKWEGHSVEIIYQGEKKMGSGKNPLKLFAVEVESEPFEFGSKKKNQDEDDDIPF